MEHRCSKRLPLKTSVAIHHNGFPVAICPAHDISYEGMCVTAGPLTYRKYTPLKVEFSITVNGATRHFSQNAVVVHNSGGKLGLMFLQDDAKLSQTLLALQNIDSMRQGGERDWATVDWAVIPVQAAAGSSS
ncbi:MAG: PilZ domain-containing protein [Granulosicoccaceae bacterium]|jgi:hypothetical protein